MKKTLFGIVTLAALALVADTAWAGTVSSSVQNVGDNIETVPILVNYGSYIVGIGLAVTGLSRLRAHWENPAQNPLRDALGRLAVSAMFISLPMVLKMLQDTGSLGGATVTYQSISALSGS